MSSTAMDCVGVVSQQGQRMTDSRSVNDYTGAEQILIFGSGTGRSSAIDQLVADLKDHHPALAEKSSVRSSSTPTTRPKANCSRKPGSSTPN